MKNFTAILAHRFNSHGYYMCRQERGINFVVYLSVFINIVVGNKKGKVYILGAFLSLRGVY
jgi:hypothetical protein